MSDPDIEAIRAALGPVVAAKAVKSVNVEGGMARLIIEVDPAQATTVQDAAEAAVKSVDGITDVQVVLTAEVGPDAKGPPPDLGLGAKPTAPQGPQPVPGVRHVIAVASGKGGVGKSTVTANLAVALAARGQRVGLLDADVYGPSQPRMLGVSGRPASPDGHVILPLRNHGVTLMSLGLMVDEDEALVWRGPMLMGALQQMLAQVQWGALDVLLVDLPPGTGDVQMTLCQKTDVSGVVIVSTPQDIALIDARKGIDMFRKMGTPILGVIENMAAFVCDTCGKVHHPFGHGGAAAEAAKLDVPFLGEVPLELSIRVAGDSGAPVVAIKPEGAAARAFWSLADTLIAGVLAE
ncbi:Mrp/NBP35 family ATP-binding protein [Actibacterium sp. 188UL27-1]|uniref:Mrp/NBP35 family ATP-binding protein n=1 Tax=Actibacterium sp. 188UL27-1 TaxID=2786961 RepID=UPI00195A2D1C|nr:Mrp/NBP35 family ATP-binding protein [Actibacterium sp. 188UL27-1]MBM7066959.1 Mrp/NBP35 family ATP-binding protein [Actibacterium sp. 188UL27-1]